MGSVSLNPRVHKAPPPWDPGGHHGYEVFLPRIEAKCARLPELAHPEHFQALGSSAATPSYG